MNVQKRPNPSQRPPRTFRVLGKAPTTDTSGRYSVSAVDHQATQLLVIDRPAETAGTESLWFPAASLCSPDTVGQAERPSEALIG